MQKLSIAVTMMLAGCSLSQAPVSNTKQADATPKTPLEEYKQCMGLSDKSFVYTKENPGRYIVLMSEKSTDQPFLNKKEQGQVYYTSLLECGVGNTLKECSEQPSLIIRNIGTKDKWKVGSIKKFTNTDLMFDKNVRAEFLNDGRFMSIIDYCYIDRTNINTTYCGYFIRKSDWHFECKDKLTIGADKK